MNFVHYNLSAVVLSIEHTHSYLGLRIILNNHFMSWNIIIKPISQTSIDVIKNQIDGHCVNQLLPELTKFNCFGCNMKLTKNLSVYVLKRLLFIFMRPVRLMKYFLYTT